MAKFDKVNLLLLTVITAFLFLTLFSISSALKNPITHSDLIDNTQIDSISNICTASNLGMEISINPCKAYDADGQNIVQYVNFTWSGTSAKNISWIFVYDGQLENGNVGLWRNISKSRTESYTELQAVSNYVVKGVQTTQNLGTPTAELCHYGSFENNTKMYNISQTSEIGLLKEQIYCFNSVNVINSSTYSLSGYAYVQKQRTVDYSEYDFDDVTSSFNYLGYGLLNDTSSYYQVPQTTFNPNQSYYIKMTYTPQNKAKNGKWHILGYEKEYGLVNSLQDNRYVYMDPWWNNTWNYKQMINFTGSVDSNNGSVLLNIPFISGKMNETGKDIRFLNISENGELYYWIRSINSTTVTAYVKVPDNQSIFMYYGNSLATTTSNQNQITLKEAHGAAFTGGSATGVNFTHGVKITPLYTLDVISINRTTGATGISSRIVNATLNTIMQDSPISNDGVANHTLRLQNGTLVYFVITSANQTPNRRYVGSNPGYVINKINIQYTAGLTVAYGGDLDLYNYESITTARVNNLNPIFGSESNSFNISLPTILFINNTPSSGSILQSLTIPFNMSIGSDVINVSVYIWNSSGIINQTKIIINQTGIPPPVINNTWWNNSYGYSKTINIVGSSTTLTNFTVAVNVTYNNHMQSDFDDIRFVNGACSNGTNVLSYELDSKVNSNSALFWVKIPTLITGTNQICMYYGNSGASSASNGKTAWDQYYMGVWHFNEGTGTIAKDSLGIYNGTLVTNIDWASGIFGDGLNFHDAGTTAVLTIDSGTAFDLSNVTMEGYINISTTGKYNAIFSDLGSATGYIMETNNLEKLGITGYGAGAGNFYGPTSLTGQTWTGVAISADKGQTGKTLVYVNGAQDGTSGTVGWSARNTLTTAWGGYAGNYVFNGAMDEMRISAASRSADWISRTYNNKDMSYVSFGSEQSAPATWWNNSYGSRQKIYVNTSDTARNQSTIKVTIPYNVNMRSDFGDLRFIASDDTISQGYWFENNSYIASTSVNVLVNVGTLDSSTNGAKYIWMYYNNPSTTTTSNLSTIGLFGDDFNEGTIDWTNSWQSSDQSKYTSVTTTGAYGKALRFDFTTSGNAISSQKSFNDFTIYSRCILSDDNEGSGADGFILAAIAPADLTGGYTALISASATYARINGNDAVGANLNDLWSRQTMSHIGATTAVANWTYDDGNTVIVQNTQTPGFATAYILLNQQNDGRSFCDWIYVTRYLSNYNTYFGVTEDYLTYSSPSFIGVNLNVPFFGNYSFNASGTNMSGSINWTENRNVQLIDNISPSITLIYPINQSIVITNSTINFTANISDNVKLKNTTIIITNQTGIVVNRTTIDLTNYMQTIVGIPITLLDGVYNWFMNIFDFNGNLATSDTYNFTIDTSGRYINILSPINNSNTSLKLIPFTINISSNIVNVSVYIYNNSGTINSTLLITGSNITVSGIKEFYNVLQNDSFLSTVSRRGGQTFTVGTLTPGPYYINNVALRLLQISNPGPTNFSIYTTSGGLPNGSALVTTSFNASVLNGSYQWYNISIPNLLVTNGTKYAFVIENTSTGEVDYGSVFPGTYTGGDCINGNPTFVLCNGGGSDLVFEIYGVNSIINTTFNPIVYTNLSVPSDGLYYFNASGTTATGLMNWSNNGQITILSSTPGITFISPNNNSNFSNKLIPFALNISSNAITASVYIFNSSGIVNYTSTSSISNITNINLTVPADGAYSFNASASNLAGLINWTENRNLLVDSTSPLVIINSPINYNYDNKTILVNITYFDINLQETWFNWNGTNQTYTVPVFVDFPENYTTLTAYANDSFGNNNQSSVTFYIDTIRPVINIIYPLNTTYNINVSELNYTLVHPGPPPTCWYSLDSGVTNISLVCGNNLTGLTSNEGSNTWRVYANDTTGNEGFDSVTFFKDSIFPIINNVSINNQEISFNNTIYYNMSIINFTANVSDNLGLKNITLNIINSTGTVNQTTINYGPGILESVVSIPVALFDGIFNWFFNVFDNLGNQAISNSSNFTIDTTSPLIIFNNAVTNPSGYNSSSNTFPISVIINETNPRSITYNVYNTTFINSTSFNGAVTGINFTLSNGGYSYNVTILDDVNNFASTENRIITLDSDGPIISFVNNTDTNNSYVNRDYINYNITVFDFNLKNITVNLYDNILALVRSNTSISSPYTGNFTGLTVGDYYLIANACDFTENCTFTSRNLIHVDLDSPAIEFSDPTLASNTLFTAYDLTNIYANVTITDVYLNNATITLLGIIGPNNYSNVLHFNFTGIYNKVSIFNNWTNLSDGVYTLFANAYDHGNHGNYTENRTIYITGNAPHNMTYETPTIINSSLIGMNIPVNVSVYEPNVKNITIRLYDFNMNLLNSVDSGSYVNNFYIEFNATNGIYYINATTTDIYNHTANLPTIFTILENGIGNISICRNLTVSGNYQLTTNLSLQNGTCIYVQQPDTTLDCRGYSIIVTNGTPISINQPRTTIRNCILDATYAINLSGGTLTLINSTLSNSDYGLFETNGASATVQSSTISGNGVGISLESSSLIMTNSAISGGTYGLLTNGDSHVTMSDSSFSSNTYGVHQNNTLTTPGGSNGWQVWGPSGAGSYTRITFTGTTNIITLLNSSYNNFDTITSNGGNLLYTLSTNNQFSRGTLGAATITLNNNSTNNVFLDTTYSGAETVDTSSSLTRSWTTVVNTVDNQGSSIGGATVHVNDGSNSTIYTNQQGTVTTSINEYVNNGTITIFNPYEIFGVLSDYGNSLFTNAPSVTVNSPGNVTLIFDKSIRSTLLTRQVSNILMALILLVGLAASTGFFIVKMRNGESVADVWKYFIIMVIWDVLFLVLFLVLSKFVMQFFYAG